MSRRNGPGAAAHRLSRPDRLGHLSIAERKRILINNIYGVDIDPQAVEVTKLFVAVEMPRR